MVKRPIFWRVVAVTLLLGLSGAPQAAPRHGLAPFEIDRQTLALGEPLRLSLTRAVDAADPPLGALDLRPLQRDFDILERTLGRDSRQENLVLTLYPRRTGRIELPTLGRPGRALSVTVTEGSDTVPRVHWKLSLDPAEPLVRQATTLTLEACDDGTLLWQRPQPPSAEGLLLRPLNETEIITQRDGQRCTAHRWHWSLMPTAAGALSLELPVLEATKFGRRLRFAPPALALQARALPQWLPAEAAVGQAEIVAEPVPAQAVLNQPLAWRLRVTGAYSAQALQSLLAMQLRQAGSPPGWAAYAPRIELQAATTLASQHLVTLYVLPQERGRLDLPDLQLPWYDPSSGQLMRMGLSGGHVEVVDPVRQRWLTGAAVLAGVIAGTLLLVWLSRASGWRLRRRRALKSLRQVRTVEALCRELQAFGVCPDDEPSPTLRAWQARMDAQFISSGLSDLLEALERDRYADHPAKRGLPPSSETPVQEGAVMQAAASHHETLVHQARCWLLSVKPR